MMDDVDLSSPWVRIHGADPLSQPICVSLATLQSFNMGNSQNIRNGTHVEVDHFTAPGVGVFRHPISRNLILLDDAFYRAHAAREAASRTQDYRMVPVSVDRAVRGPALANVFPPRNAMTAAGTRLLFPPTGRDSSYVTTARLNEYPGNVDDSVTMDHMYVLRPWYGPDPACMP